MRRHRSKKALFDHCVDASDQQGRQLQAELPYSFFVDDKLIFRWSLNGQLGGIGAAQDSINIGCGACEKLVGLHPVRHETAGLAEEAKRVDRGQPALRNQRSNLNAACSRDRIWQKNEATIRLILE
jgi:hypothetical protein